MRVTRSVLVIALLIAAASHAGEPRVLTPTPEGPSADLRSLAFTRTADELGLNENETGPVFGLIMETGYPKALVSLVVFAEGSTSIYFGNGGGIIGAGEHAPVRKAASELISTAATFVPEMKATKGPDLPAVGEVRFYLLTYSGLRSAAGIEEELGSGNHKLSPLFFAAHQVISAVRENSNIK